MAIETKKERYVRLLNRDFRSLKRDLMAFGQAYHTSSFTDYNEASAGMAILEFAAYVGDGLSYYTDQALNEAGDSATELKNVVANAKRRGHNPLGKRAAVGTVHWALEVPATVDSNGRVIPNDLFTPTLVKGSQATAKNGTVFETLEDIPFTASLGREVTGSRFDSVTGVPTHFGIRRSVPAIAGRTVSETFTVSDFKQFRRIPLGQTDVIEVISVIDSEGDEWFEVDYLAQDWVFVEQTNQNDDGDVVPYVLKLQSAPRRFIIDRDIVTGVSSLVFGSGDGLSFDDELVPNVACYSLPLAGRRSYNSFSIDPRNFLKTRSLGLSPHNTVLTVKYRIGGGEESNVPARSIDQVSSAILSFSSTGLDALKKGAVEGSIGCTNLASTQGGGPPETIKEIKANAAASQAAQNRVVTREDVIARVLSLPSKFGRIDKAFVKVSPDGRFSYDIHVLTRDANGHLARASSALKTNISTYLRKFKMLTDGINILDGSILNFRCHFGVTVSSSKNKSEVLSNCMTGLRQYFAIDSMQLSEPIIVSDVVAFLQSMPGVISVYELTFTNVFGVTDGLQYSDNRFSISDSLRNGMMVCPPGSIFEMKHPMKDIVGSAR